MATLKDTVNLTDQLTQLTQELHGELTDGDVDFDKLIKLADEISEQADQLASAFERVNEALTEPLEHVENGSSGASTGSGASTSSESSTSSGSTSGGGSSSSGRSGGSASRRRSSSSSRSSKSKARS
jgi:methyl-accepting chemotaxis protein